MSVLSRSKFDSVTRARCSSILGRARTFVMFEERRALKKTPQEEEEEKEEEGLFAFIESHERDFLSWRIGFYSFHSSSTCKCRRAGEFWLRS